MKKLNNANRKLNIHRKEIYEYKISNSMVKHRHSIDRSRNNVNVEKEKPYKIYLEGDFLQKVRYIDTLVEREKKGKEMERERKSVNRENLGQTSSGREIRRS